MTATLGVHFITSQQERWLLTADNDGDTDTVGELLEQIEESWNDDAVKVDTDKAWVAIHRCLTGGALDPVGGEYRLSHATLGGRRQIREIASHWHGTGSAHPDRDGRTPDSRSASPS